MMQVATTFLAWAVCIGTVTSVVVNKDVQRTIDAASAIVKLYIDIKADGVGKEYQLVFPTYEAKHLAFLSVTRKGKDLIIAAPVE